MYYPQNLVVAIIVAVVYCFIFWKMDNLGKFKKPLFMYSILIQLAFIAFLVGFMSYFNSNEGVSQSLVTVFGDGIYIFYFLFIIPFLISLWIQTYRGIQKLENNSFSKLFLLLILVITTLGLSVLGFYVHFFLYYGFAP